MAHYLRVRKFSELQHYADRPDNPWVKFYVRVLDDEELNALPVPTRLLFDRFLLLAQRHLNVISNDPERIAKLTGIPTRDVREGISQLLAGQFLIETPTNRKGAWTTKKRRASNQPGKNSNASKDASKRASKDASPRARPENRAEKEEETPHPSEGVSTSLGSEETGRGDDAMPNGASPAYLTDPDWQTALTWVEAEGWKLNPLELSRSLQDGWIANLTDEHAIGALIERALELHTPEAT